MTCNLLISWRQLWYVFLLNLKIWPGVLHFFAYDSPPKSIAIILIKCLWILHWIGDIYTKLVSSNPILWFQLSNDTVVLCQHMLDPPWKCRVACNMSMYRIFGHLHRVWVLYILEGHPFCATILPLYEYSNPLCCLYGTLFSGTRCDEHVQWKDRSMTQEWPSRIRITDSLCRWPNMWYQAILQANHHLHGGSGMCW